MSKKPRPPIPDLGAPIIETHCHLDYLDETELMDTLGRSKAVGVERIITISVSLDNQDTVRDLTAVDPMIWCTQGLHPHEASSWSPAFNTQLKTNLEHDKVVAVGEIGLDYYYEHSERDTQIAAFEAQLEVACQTDKPVVIHTREADEDTQAILKNFSSKLKQRGVIHSFTSGMALAEFCLAEGFHLGFNGICTFKNADNVRDIIRATPLHQILLETDAPYLTPVPYRGVPNASFYLPFIAEKVAELKDVDTIELLSIARANSFNCFFELSI